jgi:hypothetical protein
MAGKVCKTCNKPGYQGQDSKMHHERRANATDYGGRRADPNAPKAKQQQEQEPDRRHFLHKEVFGKKDGSRA